MERGINPVFPLPIFVDQAEGSEYELIQKELTTVKSKLKFNDTGNNHMILNDDPFRSHFLSSHNCSHTINFINKNIQSYISSLYGGSNTQWVIIESWMAKTLKGRSAREHSHGSYDISGVYYLDTNGNDGNLIFTNTNHNLESNMLLHKLIRNGDAAMPLKNGKIFLWPGQLRHKTLINETDHERISISFNITISRKRLFADKGLD